MNRYILRNVDRLDAVLPANPRLAVIGSASFHRYDSEPTCRLIGESLAQVEQLVLITGGVPGVGETIGRAFFSSRQWLSREPQVFHILPEGSRSWDYGKTLFAGTDMSQRREVLGRLAQLYLVVEGGPGTVHEAEVAMAAGAILLPIGRSGGCAGELYNRVEPPQTVPCQLWQQLGMGLAASEDVAEAVRVIVEICVREGE